MSTVIKSHSGQYCERIAPDEKIKTCREIGARAVFEKKIQDEDIWKLYKRARKRSKCRFRAWLSVNVWIDSGTGLRWFKTDVQRVLK